MRDAIPKVSGVPFEVNEPEMVSPEQRLVEVKEKEEKEKKELPGGK